MEKHEDSVSEKSTPKTREYHAIRSSTRNNLVEYQVLYNYFFKSNTNIIDVLKILQL